MKTKVCPNCKIEKPVSEFSKCVARKRDGLAWECRKCRSTRDKQYYQRNRKEIIKKVQEYWSTHKDQKRNNDLRAKYGINLDDYNCLLKQQEYKCAICKTTPAELHPRSKKQLPLAVDHRHSDGMVRGLLCRSCNQKLGIYERYKEKFELYLEYFNK